jgi:hypothetical protein
VYIGKDGGRPGHGLFQDGTNMGLAWKIEGNYIKKKLGLNDYFSQD